MTSAPRDDNSIPTLMAVSNADGTTPVVLYADPTTHRLLVSATSGALGDLSDVTITSAAQGDILYRNASAWVNLAAGTTGKYLKTQGAGANPTWDTPGGVSGTINEIAYFDSSSSITSLAVATYPSLTELSYVKGVTSGIQAQINAKGVGTVTAVSSADGNATVATGTSTPVITIVSAPKLATARTIGGVSFDGTANITVSSATGGFTVSGGDLALGTNNLTMSGSIGVTGTRVTKGWFVDLEVTNAIAGSITGNAATVSTITGLAPDTATTQATQASITTCANLTTVGTVTTGNVDAVVSAANLTTAGKVELATAAETNTGTDATRALTPDGFQASNRNLRFITFVLVDSTTDVTVDTDFGGDFTIPFAGVIQQADGTPDWCAAYTDTAGTTGTMVVDVHLNGTTIMTTNKLDIETTEKDSTTAATQPDLTTTAIAAGDILTFDIDAIHTTAAKGLKVTITILMT